MAPPSARKRICFGTSNAHPRVANIPLEWRFGMQFETPPKSDMIHIETYITAPCLSLNVHFGLSRMNTNLLLDAVANTLKFFNRKTEIKFKARCSIVYFLREITPTAMRLHAPSGRTHHAVARAHISKQSRNRDQGNCRTGAGNERAGIRCIQKM